MAETDSNSTQTSLSELELQLELRDSNIANLRKMLDQKDELLMITSDQLKDSENRRTEMEEALIKVCVLLVLVKLYVAFLNIFFHEFFSSQKNRRIRK